VKAQECPLLLAALAAPVATARSVESSPRARRRWFSASTNGIAAQGLGNSKPIETNATPEGRVHNRRVELARKCP